jgi:hypothetical protein
MGQNLQFMLQSFATLLRALLDFRRALSSLFLAIYLLNFRRFLPFLCTFKDDSIQYTLYCRPYFQFLPFFF